MSSFSESPSLAASNTPPSLTPALPDGIYLTITGGEIAALTDEGEVLEWTLSQNAPLPLDGSTPIITVLAPRAAKLLNLNHRPLFDVLELFAFIAPAQFCAPTVKGLCQALHLAAPETAEDAPLVLQDILIELFAQLRGFKEKDKQHLLEVAAAMGRQGHGWVWTPFIFAALDETYNPDIPITAKDVMAIWKDLPEWAEEAPASEGAHYPLSETDAVDALKDVLNAKQNSGHEQIEPRAQQQDYARAMSHLYAPRNAQGELQFLSAEAGTGVGKTLGYLAPAKAYAEKNEQSVWVSTYTKNLQRQMDQEIKALYPDASERERKAVIRKGRENYLCLLNLEELISASALARTAKPLIAAGLMARWASAAKDGDLTGNDFPGWLSLILGYQDSYGLSDKRGECIYSACDHYHKCFIERGVRKSRHARIVVANHALVMVQAALASVEDDIPARVIFDEGHHLFDAADSAFAAHLTGQEMTELRRWILGPESERKGGRNSRSKGIQKRFEDLVAGHEEASDLLNQIIRGAHILTAPGWLKRVEEGQPAGHAESFLSAVKAQVEARHSGGPVFYSLESDVFPLSENILSHAASLQNSLRVLAEPMKALAKHFISQMDEAASLMEKDTRRRMEAGVKGLMRRADMTLGAWISMLSKLLEGGEEAESKAGKTPSLTDFADWFEITRSEGRMIDVGFYRHHIDPMKPFADTLAPHIHGLGVTSATLRADNQDDAPAAPVAGEDQSWGFADLRMGTNYLVGENLPQRLSLPSPYDYAQATRVFVINDINKNDGDAVSTAFRELFLASGGGALGIFTSIQRLKYVQNKIMQPLTERHLPLYAQHVDDMDIGTLIDMFREEEQSCLLGTDAVRDGVDVPGRSLRLLAFDRVPWPRPDILHRERKKAFAPLLGSARAYDEALTRLKLKQAYGRLIRSASDKGVFIMLDNALPTRLCDAFPKDVKIQRQSLSQTCADIKDFLKSSGS
jgi:ATP-dependent DNA helicase DinG